ncbi:MAG: heavy metal-binding domain-containing protein [Elusimicrobia bacterium]|nr:heavy metal-binding domain-containing protein [Elusimicrobiota bacterium]
MKIFNMFIVTMLLGYLLGSSPVFAMACHGSDGDEHSEHKDGKKPEKEESERKIEAKESFYSSVYVCPMHPEVQSEKSGKCPKCGMNLEMKQVLLTYACPEKDCDYQKAKPGKCPHHDKELIKTEVKYHCPKCGEQVNPEELKLKPVKS